MKNILNFVKTISFVFVLTLIAFSGAVFAEDLIATINITGNTNITVGESTTLMASWTTNKDFNREAWTIGPVGFTASPSVPNPPPSPATSFNGTGVTSGSSFSSPTIDTTILQAGQYDVCYSIWHDAQLTKSSRGLAVCQTITVNPPAIECGGKDAPAIATDHIHDLFPPSDPRRQANQFLINDIGNTYMDAVTKAFTYNGTTTPKCVGGVYNDPDYTAAVIEYVDSNLIDPPTNSAVASYLKRLFSIV